MDCRRRRFPGGRRAVRWRRGSGPRCGERPRDPAARSHAWPRRRAPSAGHLRQGRYHNTRYKALGEELGLVVTQVAGIGWSGTALAEGTAAVYAAELVQLAAAITAYRYSEGSLPSAGDGDRGGKGGDGEAGSGGAGGGRGGSSKNGLVLVCDCPRRIRVSSAAATRGRFSVESAPPSSREATGRQPPRSGGRTAQLDRLVVRPVIEVYGRTSTTREMDRALSVITSSIYGPDQPDGLSRGALQPISRRRQHQGACQGRDCGNWL